MPMSYTLKPLSPQVGRDAGAADRQDSAGVNSPVQAPAYLVGWDVGGWNCDKNGENRDAIVILDASLAIIGKSWRGNLRANINAANTSEGWVQTLFALCGAASPPIASPITLAIDTPLGFSRAFVELVSGLNYVEPVNGSATNPYLFRQTERYLFEQGIRPLSAVKDMIGSQATKGMHALAKFAPKVARCGVWTDGGTLTAIEAFPSPCKHSALMNALLLPYAEWRQANHQDKVDAMTCALIAHCFQVTPDKLKQPGKDVPVSEGWIWLPKDALSAEMHDGDRLKLYN